MERELQMIRFHSDMLGLLEKRWFLDSNLLGLAPELAVFHSNLLGFASLEKIESNGLEPRYQLIVEFRNGRYL